MNISVVFGILLIAIGAFSSGSFAVPFSKIKSWNWETYWMIFSFGGYIIFPWIACCIFAPGMFSVFAKTGSGVLLSVFLLGAIYGVGNLSFGLALRYLGLSLGYALSLGLMLAIGTLIPPLLDGRLQLMLQSSGGTLLIAGVVVAVVGIIFSAWAGILKDRTVSAEKKQETIGEFNLVKGILSALLVGFAGSAMALGFEEGMPIAIIAEESGVDPLFSMMPVYVVFLVGTLITTLIWCVFLGVKNKSLQNYVRPKNKRVLTLNYAFGLLAGFLWFSQFIFFSMGKSKMGPFTFTSWGILMALTIAFATVWGLIRKEWKGASVKVYVLMACSLLILIAASFMIGISGSE
ncbi:L-rhamnose/proton symporter RhaT [uncultured Sunxiuqinia sp.]|uniref:L-rhamnose/proton symporter RhaT n=1 Tax=uncultured Sunxiuqinia sp. TaxID=1573825 RepID=UPI002606ED22|nr:L-rhamnose/proton symporter RhaT [uncultured Sunxiuqinia sp.]